MAQRKTEFSRALAAAKTVLRYKIKQREKALKDLTELNLEIPNLERTVRALHAQLDTKSAGRSGPLPVPEMTTVTDRRQGDGKVAPDPSPADRVAYFNSKTGVETPPSAQDVIPPEIRAQLPKEDLTGMASHYGIDTPDPGENLPEITGKELIPEK